MQHFPIYLSMSGRRVVLAGGGEAALAKLRLLLKTPAEIAVFAPDALPGIEALAAEGRLALVRRPLAPGDADGAALVYGAAEDAAEDARVAAIGRAAGALVNIVDDLGGSDFITPAIVDRAPVTVAIGTEGAAPVLARAIKADLEARLPAGLGILARLGKAFRPVAEALAPGRARRAFWAEFFGRGGPDALARGGEPAAAQALDTLLERHLGHEATPGAVAFVGAGPGDPELLTLKARRALDEADVVLHDRLVPGAILELARREAKIVACGKTGFGPSTSQDEINALMVRHARAGARVVRLKSGDPGVFGRLEEEIEACEAAGVAWQVVPGITAAAAAGAALGRSLTRRGRNDGVRLLTAHDMAGFAEHDWRALARPGAVAALYMGKRAARFVQGRLMMHGAAPDLPVSFVENASRPEERVIATRLHDMAAALSRAAPDGPVVTFIGLAPRAARAAARDIAQQELA